MTRQEKYPNTQYFQYYNHNPHKRICDDCVIRAIGDAFDMSWEDTLRTLTEIGLQRGTTTADSGTYITLFASYDIGKQKQPTKKSNSKFKGWEWLDYLQQNYNQMFPDVHAIVAHIGTHHIVCIKLINGKFVIRDIWDSSKGVIGNYFVITNEKYKLIRDFYSKNK